MTRREKFSAAIYVVAIVAALAFTVVTLAKCGGARGPAREAARVTRFVVEANCPDLMPVGECLEQIDRNADAVDALLPDGGR